MNLNFKLICSSLLFSTVFISNSAGQTEQIRPDTLILNDLGRGIENSIKFNTTNSNLRKIEDIPGTKFDFTVTSLVINGDTLEALTISTRGQSTLNFRRKSFTFDLKSKATFHHGERIESFKKFYLISLSMDKNYCSNRLAFEMMEDLHMFYLFYSFCELRINGESDGIYMLVERPEDWAMKMKKSPLLIRRGITTA